MRAVAAVGMGAFAWSSLWIGGCSSDDAKSSLVMDGPEPDLVSEDPGFMGPGGNIASGAGGSSALGAPPWPSSGGASAAGASGSGGAASAADAGLPTPEPIVPPVVNPFTVVAHDPLSTFAVDVDTASYDLFVRSVESGSLPAPEGVRTEEFVNFFRYEYPPPAADAVDPFSISLAAAPGLFADGTSVLRVGIQGRMPPPFEKKETSLVFLVDVSGSMQSADKLPLVQRVLLHTLDVLDPTDTVSIVTYASGTGVALGPTPVSARGVIEGVITGLSAGGSTNGAGGIQLAYEQAALGFLEGGINHVLLCTDGDFNVGLSGTAALVDFIEEKRTTGVTLTALGFGASPNDQMMNAVSNAGNGIYGAITSPSQADRYVEDRMLSTLVHIAKDVKIQLEFNPESVYAYRLIGYEDRAIADHDFRNDAVDAGEIGAGHRVTALYQLVTAGGAIPTPEHAAPLADGAPYDGAVEVQAGDLVLVKVRYKPPGALETDPATEIAVRLSAAAAHASLDTVDPDMQWAVAVATFSEILRGSPYASEGALGPLGVLVDRNAGTDSDRLQFRTLFGQARSLILAP